MTTKHIDVLLRSSLDDETAEADVQFAEEEVARRKQEFLRRLGQVCTDRGIAVSGIDHVFPVLHLEGPEEVVDAVAAELRAKHEDLVGGIERIAFKGIDG